MFSILSDFFNTGTSLLIIFMLLKLADKYPKFFRVLVYFVGGCAMVISCAVTVSCCVAAIKEVLGLF